MMWQTLAAASRLTAIVALALASSACATVMSGTTQEVFIESEPSGAECKVDRLGANVGVVKPTPGRVNVSRSKETMIVTCVREGYQPSNEVLASSFTGATLGNILLGGIVGGVVDASSGANNKYPDRVMIVLTPESFPDEPARDRHFAAVKERLEASADAEIKRINSNCGSTGKELCEIEARKVAEARDKALADVDRGRLAAKIIPKA
jgi:hypothetical protein